MSVAPSAVPMPIFAVLSAARSGLRRLDPRQAFVALGKGAVLVDIRPAEQRADEGVVPGALVVERNVLEWRFDPSSDACLPMASYDLNVVVLCSEGYTSSLAAASLQQLGITNATDVIGGFTAWRDAGLPTSVSAAPPTLSLVTHPAKAGDGRVEVHVAERRAYVDGVEMTLTRLEFDLLAHLAEAPGHVHTRDALLRLVWDDRPTAEGSRTLDVHVHRLRRKLGPDVALALQTVRGVGYRWSP